VPKIFTQLLRTKKHTYPYLGKFNLGGTFMFDRGNKSTQINAKNLIFEEKIYDLQRLEMECWEKACIGRYNIHLMYRGSFMF